MTPPPTRSNWNRPEIRSAAFQRIREFTPTVPIRASDHGAALPRDLLGVGSASGRWTAAIDEFMGSNQVSGLMVLQAGAVRFESYRNGLTRDSNHLLWSVSKSVVSSVVGILCGAGAMKTDDPVIDHVPELLGTAWEGVTVRHLLNMRGGMRWEEDVGDDAVLHDHVYLRSSGNHPPLSALHYLSTISPDVEPGGAFQYQSIMTDVLAWVVEAVTQQRLPTLISDLLWRSMGARIDAEMSVDFYGNPMADSGMSASLEDLARFGELWRNRGKVGDHQVIPERWIADTVADSTELRAAFAVAGLTEPGVVAPRLYRNNWWVIDPSVPFYAALGYLGQSLHIHEESGVVVAMFSAWDESDNSDSTKLRSWSSASSTWCAQPDRIDGSGRGITVGTGSEG